MSKVKKVFFIDLLQCPPYTFNIVVIHSYVRVIHIDPEPQTFCHLFPFFLVGENRFFTVFYKILDSVFFYLTFAVQTELFLDFYLNRKTVCIPACLSWYMMTGHCLITVEYIFKCSSQNMTRMGFAVCGRWTFIKDKQRITF